MADPRVHGSPAGRPPREQAAAWERETYGRPLVATVRDPDAVPYATESDDLFIRRVLQEEWPHEPILDATARFGKT